MTNVFANALRRLGRLFAGRDRGTVAISFLLCLPILIMVVGVIVQYAMLVQTRLVIVRALSSAARSAVTALPSDQVIGDRGGPDVVRRAAFMMLQSISPPATDSSSAEALNIADALQQTGLTPPTSFAARYTFAQQAAVVTVVPIDNNGMEISDPNFNYKLYRSSGARITIVYQAPLVVPGINKLYGTYTTIAGVTGYFSPMTVTQDVQLSPGREAAGGFSGNGSVGGP